MAVGGGKPLAEASVRLSVEGAPQVQQTLTQTAGAANATAGAMGGAAAATDNASTSLAGATKNARELTSTFTRLVGAATSVVGAVYAVGRAVQSTAEYIRFLTDSTSALNDIVQKNGGLVPGSSREAQAQLDAVRQKLEGVNAELGKSAERADGLSAAIPSALRGVITVGDALINGTGRLSSTIEKERDALLKQADSLQRRLVAEKEREDAAKRRKAIEEEENSTLTEQEKLLKRLDDLDKLRSGSSPEEAARIDAVKRRIEAEYKERQRKEAEIQREQDAAASKRVKDAVSESRERIEQINREERERVEARERAEKAITDRLSGAGASELRSIAATSSRTAQLLQLQLTQQGVVPWRS